MRHSLLLLVIIFGLGLASCEEEVDTTACINLATVYRTADQEGCNIILEMDNGTRLIPTWYQGSGYGFCLVGFDFSYADSMNNLLQDQVRVQFGYTITGEADYCQGLPIAYINCLEVLESPETPVR